MVREAEENAEADKKQKDLIDARNQAEGTVHSVKKDYDTYKDQLADAERTAFETAEQAVNDACKGEDPEAIKDSVQKLFEAAAPVFTKKQAATSAQAQPEQQAEQTVDASFKEVDDTDKQ